MVNKIMAATIGLALTVSVLTTIYSQEAFALIPPRPGSPAGGPCVSGPVCGGNAGNAGIGGNGGTCTSTNHNCVQNGEPAGGGNGGSANGGQGQNGGSGGVGCNGGSGCNGGIGAVGAPGGSGAPG